MIKFDPTAFVKKIASSRKIKKLLKQNVSLKKAALNFVDQVDFLDKQSVVDVALKTIKSYKQRIRDNPEIKNEILDDPKQLIQRVQNEVIFQAHTQIKETYGGERAIWLPSDANEPRPEHQLNYGKEYTVGEGIGGIEPGDEYGCRCGVQILTKDTQLNLGGN